jgi:hypothetical protein
VGVEGLVCNYGNAAVEASPVKHCRGVRKGCARRRSNAGTAIGLVCACGDEGCDINREEKRLAWTIEHGAVFEAMGMPGEAQTLTRSLRPLERLCRRGAHRGDEFVRERCPNLRGSDRSPWPAYVRVATCAFARCQTKELRGGPFLPISWEHSEPKLSCTSLAQSLG